MLMNWRMSQGTFVLRDVILEAGGSLKLTNIFTPQHKEHNEHHINSETTSVFGDAATRKACGLYQLSRMVIYICMRQHSADSLPS